MTRLAAAVVVLGLSARVAGAQGMYLLGAAKVDVTPPPFDAAADAVVFPTCPAAVFTGRRPRAASATNFDQSYSIARSSHDGRGRRSILCPW